MARHYAPAVARPRERRPDRAIAGSARRVDLARPALADKQVKAQADWQEDAWAFYDGAAVVRYGVQWLGSAVSKVRLYLALVDPTDPGNVSSVRDEDGNPLPSVPLDAILAGEEQLRRLGGETGGAGEILRVLTMQLEVPGEGYLVGYGERPPVLPDLLNHVEGTPAVPESWEVRSTDEVWSEGGAIRVGDGRSDPNARTLDPVLDDAIRLWQRHPRRQEWADSPMRSMRNDLLALDTYTKLRLAEGNSRRAAGVFLVPESLRVVTRDGDGIDPTTDGATAILDAIEDAYVEAIDDPQNPESVMPVVLMGPESAIAVVRHMELSRTADAVLDERIEKLVNGIARGMNVPVEVIMGHMATTFSNAQQIDEDIFDDHLEPRLTFLVDALTEHWLRPLLVDAWGVPAVDAVQVRVWFDPAALLSKPDRRENADKLHAAGAIGDVAWREASGFTDEDAATPEERVVASVLDRMLIEPAVGFQMLKAAGFPIDLGTAPTPMLPAGAPAGPAAALPAIPPPVPVEAPPVPVAAPPTAVAAAGGRRPRRPLGERLAAQDRELRARLVTAADREMVRALEKAGGRIRKKLTASARPLVAGVPNIGVAARLGRSLVADLFDDGVLDDAWDDLGDTFDRQVRSAQANALRWTADGLDLDPLVVDRVAAQQALDVTAARDWFIDSMGTITQARMFDPVAAAPTLGEWEVGARVPTGLVRHALALAGGGNGIVDGPGAWVALAGGGSRPVGGIGTGELLRSTMADAGARIEGYRWDYGASTNSFEAHLELDGQTFESFDDDILVNDADFPDGDFYMPGDHAGCLCDVTPTMLGPDGQDI